MRSLRLSRVLARSGPTRDRGSQNPLEAQFSLHRAFSQSERSHRSASAAKRHNRREAPPCDRESIGVALVLTM
jgi:hypothetical protein